jgi:hypothetical protein
MCVMTVLLIGGSSMSVPAQNSPGVRSLKGISAVSVLVEDLPNGAKVLGLTKEMIQTDIELKLRLAGMRVVTDAEGLKIPGSPTFYVVVNLTDDASAACIGVELDQSAQLLRDGQFAPSVDTWSKGIVMSHPTAQTIRDNSKDLVDMFLNAWLSVNPKK